MLWVLIRNVLQVPQQGTSSEYPQHVFVEKKKNNNTFWQKKKSSYVELCLCPPTCGEGDIIVFGADPVGIDVGIRLLSGLGG